MFLIVINTFLTLVYTFVESELELILVSGKMLWQTKPYGISQIQIYTVFAGGDD